jgi:hypothetical protein
MIVSFGNLIRELSTLYMDPDIDMLRMAEGRRTVEALR